MKINKYINSELPSIDQVSHTYTHQTVICKLVSSAPTSLFYFFPFINKNSPQIVIKHLDNIQSQLTNCKILYNRFIQCFKIFSLSFRA